MEAGMHSPWVSREVESLGHDVVVANPSEVYGRRRRKKRNDPSDAEFLARQGRADVALLHPIRHRGVQAQQDLALIRARDQLVRVRSKLIGHVRGAVKSLGGRISRCSAEAFARRANAQLPAELCTALEPVLEMIADLTVRIRAMDRSVAERVEQSYPEALRLQQPSGVGPLTALAFVLLVDDPRRFARSRDVGAYFGLVPRLDESSDSSPQLRITKAGDELGRRLLVSAAQYILGRFGPDCDLRRHGERIAARGGKNARKRAAVAVARKLAVMLHRLWMNPARYDPDHLLKRRCA
jgi:transposase